MIRVARRALILLASFEANADGLIEIPDRRAWRRENPFVQLSEMPLGIGLGVD